MVRRRVSRRVGEVLPWAANGVLPLLLAVVSLGCSPAPAPAPDPVGEGTLHRLTPSQLDRALNDLVGRSAGSVVPRVREPVQSGFVDDRTRGPTPYIVEELVRWAADAAIWVARDFPAQVPECTDQTAECGRIVAAALLERAWRRPVTEEERDWVVGVFDAHHADGDFDDALRKTAASVLSAPDFLYLVERGIPLPGEDLVRLDSHEVASRLSFLLWDRPPTQLVRRAAESGLDTADAVQALTRDMLEDGRRRDGLNQFFAQWLDVDGGLNEAAWDLPTFGPLISPSTAEAYELARATNNAQVQVDAEVEWRAVLRELRSELRGELDELVDRMLAEDATLATLLTTPHAYVGPLSQYIYDVSPGGGLIKRERSWVELDPARWPGVLTRGAVLSARGHLTEPSPVLRGAFIAERLLCRPPPAPPPGIPSLDAATRKGTWTTNRERYEIASSPPVCAGCHDDFNPFGYVLEEFHAIGVPREVMTGEIPNTSAELPGLGMVSGPGEMMARLADSREVHDCFVSQFFRFATYGAATTHRDQVALSELQDAFWASRGNLRSLVVSFVGSEAFRTRSTEEEAP